MRFTVKVNVIFDYIANVLAFQNQFFNCSVTLTFPFIAHIAGLCTMTLSSLILNPLLQNSKVKLRNLKLNFPTLNLDQ